jgi:FkbH-like protein
MTLTEALRLVNSSRATGSAGAPVFLVCGFEPLHLATFVQAHVIEHRQGEYVDVVSGLFGDLPGNIRKAAQSNSTTVALILEWDDLDPGLGLRSGRGWTNAARRDIETTCHDRLGYIAKLVESLVAGAVVALAGPSLPLPPLGHTVDRQAAAFKLGLQHEVAGFLRKMADVPGVRILDPMWMASTSPIGTRLDPKLSLMAGCPYSTSHADVLAAGLTGLLYPAAPKKGLIVDLDDTLWSGIIGEAGVDGVSWSLGQNTQVHALLQQMLAAMAENGVLLAIASKNEPALVEQIFSRTDLLVKREAFFPVLAGWGPKSAAVGGIIRAWNIGADSVVFLDDDPMELAEVQAVHPEITALQFRPKDTASVWELLGQLRNLFGKPAVFAEDSLRANSIRSAPGATNAHFLETVGGKVTISYRKDPGDKRAIELINKTNQFNLNGVRIPEGDWLARLRSDDSIAATISYEDRFGPLGKIAAVLGVREGREIRITSWVMSCRVFSRRIEHHTLDSLFRIEGVDRLRFDYRPTDRNQPVQHFFEEIGVECSETDGPTLSLDRFSAAGSSLPHEVVELK